MTEKEINTIQTVHRVSTVMAIGLESQRSWHCHRPLYSAVVVKLVDHHECVTISWYNCIKFYVNCIAVSTKPVQCHVTAVGIRFISLAWQSPSGGSDLYEVSFWINTVNSNISTVYTPFPNITIAGLQPLTVYMFTVGFILDNQKSLG
jgi:hypothetical protein